ncbi:MAG: metal ABC transporter substrate-binding protein [Verrucomicrobiales bacterium]|nr:metal ABC transporter substrate-binding protein [Verrucomicrobiales bacterium]
MKTFIAFFLLSTALANAGAKPVIAATNEPMRYFAERLAGHFADVLYLVPDGVDPEFWKPTDDNLVAIQSADLILMNGATYEKWAVTAALPFSRLVDTSQGFSNKFITVENAVTHSHGGEGEHTHGGTASVTWLDLEQAALQAEAAGTALVRAFPKHATSLKKKTAALSGELRSLHQAMQKAAAPIKGSAVIASHPYFDYWSRAYGVEVAALSWEPNMKLGEKEMADFQKLRAQHPQANFFLWDDAPSATNRKAIEREGLIALVLTPTMNRPTRGDFISAMRENVERLAAATKK